MGESALRASQLGAITRGTLLLRLATAALSIPSLRARDPDALAALGALVLVLAVSLVPLLVWRRVVSSVVAHPMWLALDLSVALVFLSLAGPGAPFVLATVATTFLGGLLYGVPGGLTTSGLLLVGYAVIALQAAARGDVVGVGVVSIALLYPLLAVAGVGLRRLLDDLAQSRAAEAAAVAEVAASQERLRLARDLHDSVGKTLHGIVLAASSLAGSSPSDVAERARHIQDGAAAAAAEARDLLHQLRSDGPESSGTLLEALRGVAVESGLPVHVVVEGEPDLWGRARTEVVTAVSEALENVRRYARAETVQLCVRREGSAVVVTVVDDGQGFATDRVLAAEAAGHYGLVGVRERLAVVGGQASWSSSPGGGTTVELVVPVT